jgi:uncharacterized protein (DUF362 family)/NAD-dependent dihydropyrimidine dehydrogenase PreA subunit
MIKVSIVRCADYDPARVTDAVAQSVRLVGGVEQAVGRRVLVKPNLLSARGPEQAVTTHPAVVEALVKLWMDAGASVSLGDSPPLAGEKEAPYTRLMEVTGMEGVAERTGAKIVRFEDEEVNVEHPHGKFYRRFTVGAAVADADILINVPKLKSHGLTTITGAVKNVFGCVPGKKKAIFHAQAGEDSETFSQMLVDLLGCMPPAISVMDAITVMEGDGPVDGRPRHLGLVMASKDAVALDAVAAAVLGLNPMEIDTSRLADAQGVGVADLTGIEIVGERIQDAGIADFDLPKSANLWTRFPPRLRTILKNQLIPYPVVTVKCRKCGACVEGCPVRTIHSGEGRPVIDLSGCIRCYCCREVCEWSAVDLKAGQLSGAIRLIRDARRRVLKALGRM